MHTTLISATNCNALVASGAPLMVFDCSFDLMNPAAGAQQYREAHIPGAVYADLDTERPAATSTGRRCRLGRAPPAAQPRALCRWLSSVGFANGMQAVVYDRKGANYCGRLWWMLKWAGHDAVAVLDGGCRPGRPRGRGGQWRRARFQPTLTLRPPPAPRLATTRGRPGVLTALALQQPGQTVIDARAAPRYRGEVEPLDPVAGHIPGALNRPFAANIGEDGRFKPAAQLRAEFEPCWRAATRPAWCTTAAAASAPCPTCWPWNCRAGQNRALRGQLERMVQRPGAPGGEAAGQVAALGWLLLLDRRDWGTAWESTSPVFRAQVPIATWMDAIPKVREPLGPLAERQPIEVGYKTTLPGRPAGDYVTVVFASRFGNKPDTEEIVTTLREADGRWRVIGYSTR
jgi:thiosulfate/3-mercaptopyruvate sulfurtransferase